MLPLQLPHCGSNENTLKTIYVDGDFSLGGEKERKVAASAACNAT